MQRVVVVSALLALLVLAAVGPLLLAQASTPASLPSADGSMAQIVADDEAGVVRVLIKGREVLVIDEHGLSVHGDIAYRGTLTDTQGGTGDEP